MSEAVKTRGDRGERRKVVKACKGQLPVGNIRFNAPQKKKTGFDVVESSPKNGEQVRMASQGKKEEGKKPTRNLTGLP